MANAKEIYKGYKAAGQYSGVLPLVENSTVLEIGFGSGKLLGALNLKGNNVYGVDAGEDIVAKAKENGFKNVYLLDSSEESIPFKDDFFDAVYCYEVFEHLSNPYRLFVETGRVLKPDHHLYFSVPTQEHSMGYGPARHSFIYPGLLERKNLERFFMQMYFKIEDYKKNITGIIHHRNYILKNMKQPDLPDIMEVIIRDYSVTQLYKGILSQEDLQVEIDKEVEAYVYCLESIAEKGDWKLFEDTIKAFLPMHKEFLPLFVGLALALFDKGISLGARNVLLRSQEIKNLPDGMCDQINNMLLRISKNSAPK